MSSGTANFTQNRDQIIRRAARLVNAIAGSETPGPQLTKDFADALNSMVKRFQATGIHVWTEEEATLFVQPGQIAYYLGPNMTDHCCPSTQVYEIFTSQPANIGDTTLNVEASFNVPNSSQIGIVLDSGFIQWSTVVSHTDTTILIADALTDTVAAQSAVYTYQSNIVRPLRVLSGRRFVWDGAISTPMNPPMSRYDYQNLPNLQNVGPTTQFFYDPQIPQGILHVWPSPPDVSAAVKFTYMRPIYDFTTPGDTGDFPVEWIDTLVYNLAYAMAPEYAIPMEQYSMIKEQAAIYLDTTASFDKEPESIYLGVNYNQR